MQTEELCCECGKSPVIRDDVLCVECAKGLPSWLKAEDGTYIDEPVFKRNRPRLKDRFRPCEWCGHPLTQRHHTLPFDEYGEMGTVLHLCANCHEIYHAYWGLRRLRQGRAFLAIKHIERRLGRDDPRLVKAREAVQSTLDFIKMESEILNLTTEEHERLIRDRKLAQSRERRRTYAKGR